MIKVTGNQPKQLTVEFGDGSNSVSTLVNCTGEKLAVLLTDLGRPNEIGEPVEKSYIQDAPETVNNLARRSVILSFPVSENGLKSLKVLMRELKGIKQEIKSCLAGSEE